MSHYTVLVIGEDPEDQLAPYQENNNGDTPSEYLEFEDTEEEFAEQYENDGTERVVMPDGTYKSRWDDSFRKEGRFGIGSDTHAIPENLEVRKVPFKELFDSLEEFAHEWHGCSERDERTGRYGYWSNPNSKWDWYQLGGRWRGYFKLKPKTEGRVGNAGAFDNEAPENTADQVYKGDVDFDAMRDEAAVKAGEDWDQVHKVLDGRSYPVWGDFVKEYEGDIDAARAAFHSHGVVTDISAAGIRLWDGDDVCHFSREEWVQQARDCAISSFAVIKDGEWYERGSMGWWGVVSGEKDKSDWNKQFAELLDNLPDDTLLSVYDCHI